VALLRGQPPATTRALTRGTLIRLIRRCGYHYEVNWTTCQFSAGTARIEVHLDDPLAVCPPEAREAITRLEGVVDGRLDPDLGLDGGAGGAASYLGWWASVAG
jgi:hypothetical protein